MMRGWLAPACNKEFEERENGALEIIYCILDHLKLVLTISSKHSRYGTELFASLVTCSAELGLSHVHRRKLCCFCFAVKS